MAIIHLHMYREEEFNNMCNPKDDETKEIERIGFTRITEMEVQEFEEQMSLNEDFRRFIQEDMKAGDKRKGCKSEGLMVSEIQTEDSYRILREEQSFIEY